MTDSKRDVKAYSEELVRGASYPPFLTPTVKCRLGIYLDQFPRIIFAGNSSQCIKTEAVKGHSYERSLPSSMLGSILLSQP